MNKRLQVLKYILADFLSAGIAWGLFFIYRKFSVDQYFSGVLVEIFQDRNFYLGVFLIPVFWLFLYTMIGTYRKIYRKSRLRELGQTLLITLIGVTILFFALLLDDVIPSYKSYYQTFMVLFCLHFIFTYSFRLLLTSITVYKIHKKIIGFNTVIVGSNGNALRVYRDLENQVTSSGNIIIGFVDAVEFQNEELKKYIPHLGNSRDLKDIINEHKVEEVIIAVEPSESKTIEDIITSIEDLEVVIKIIPSLKDFLLGSVKMSSIFHAPLIQISPDLMPAWQMSLKRVIDVVVSIFCLIILSPVFLFIAIGVWLTSKGPIVYSQERIGLHGKVFIMHKFRTMYSDAEKHGPQLSSKSDNRITPFGRFLRKVRLDEIPQFYTVLKGDMSLVGYRPERQFFIDQIVQRAPHYRLLYKVKPGITSWGQVKFGYASNVDEMIERLQYDLLYIENMSLAVDLKILIYTVLIVLQGRGK